MFLKKFQFLLIYQSAQLKLRVTELMSINNNCFLLTSKILNYDLFFAFLSKKKLNKYEFEFKM
jgi:hypothetical protein